MVSALNISILLKTAFIVMIVLQSFAFAVSATTEHHQIDSAHLQTEHDHLSHENAVNDQAAEQDHNEKDCHHCGHCNGAHLSLILINHSDENVELPTPLLIPYQFAQAHALPEARYRPPIS